MTGQFPWATSTRLSRRLRRETKVEHRLAEATRLARAFFGGHLDTGTYALGLARIEPVYEALETALAAPDVHPLLVAFQRPELSRLEAIRADLRQYGPASRPSACAYAHRIRVVARDAPLRLIGHFYVRSFADLSGMAVVRPVAHRLLGLDRKMPLAFFDLPDVADRKALRAELRAYLDAVPAAHHDDIVDEASTAFRLHRTLVDDLMDEIEGRRPGTPLPSTG